VDTRMNSTIEASDSDMQQKHKGCCNGTFIDAKNATHLPLL